MDPIANDWQVTLNTASGITSVLLIGPLADQVVHLPHLIFYLRLPPRSKSAIKGSPPLILSATNLLRFADSFPNICPD